MEASTKKGQLRSQLLAGEHDINTLSGFAASGRSQMPDIPQRFPVGQHPQQQGPYGQYQPQQSLSNHDLITPVNQRANFDNASRKGSMASTMSMGRLFKKKEAFFDDDAGYDIGDVSGNTVTFNDIKHLRDNNSRYSISSRTTDSTPIIPVLNAGGKQNSSNNIQYRKYMNHKKKMDLASGARAMSLAGGNPMAANSMTQDSRAMSMGMMSDPRAMSLSSAPQGGHMGPGRPMGPAPNGYGPRAMSMRPAGPGRVPPGQRGPMPPNIRTNSLNSNVMLNQGPMQGLSPQAIRSQSLTQGGGPFPQPQRFGPNHGPNQHMQMPYGPPGGHPGGHPAGPPNGMYGQGPRPNGHAANARFNGMSPHAAQSNESFMNVVKEEDEKEETAETPQSLDPKAAQAQSDTVDLNELPEDDEEEDEEDIVYKFENDATSPQISRKSTVKKSNSMRVRKLDLFNKKDAQESPETVFEDQDSLTFNMDNARDRTSKKSNFELEDAEVSDMNRQSAQKFQALGSSASEPDIYTTASEFSPTKNTGKSEASEEKDSETHSPDLVSPSSNVEREAANDSVTSNNTQKRKVIKMKSLVANTAFNNFRSPSSNSQATFSSESNSKESSDFDHHDNKNYPNSSKISIYSHDYSRAEQKGFTPEDENARDVHLNDETTYEQSLNDERPQLPPKQSVSGAPSSPTRVGSETPYESHSANDSFRAPSSEYVSSNDTRSEDVLARDTPTGFLSRSGSDMNMEKYKLSGASDDRRVPSSADQDTKERRKSRNSSISSKSKNFIKRLSRSGSKSVEKEADSASRHRSVSSISSMKDVAPVKKPLHFTKDELAIMTCNNDLQNELQLVASELAVSIKRELALESQLRSRGGEEDHDRQSLINRDMEYECREKSRQIALLQEKLNNERRLRFISEEHAILAEHGQTPSALKLDYEKNELYKQLLAKNDLVNQLQDKLEEFQTTKNERGDDNLLENYNELLRKNHELQSQLSNQVKAEPHSAHWFSSEDLNDRRESLLDRDSEKAEIMSLRTQRDELREMITKLTSSQNVELKIAHDKIKTLEFKLEKMSLINDKLSRREKSGSSQPQESGPKFSSGQGGKLQGLSIVTPKHNLFDE
ncbi:hypothetical protein FT663_04419 [Candidozyma haemuli var. vulneris]|uniref:Uncharacterized protein n=1 Tax=Candidozyma haemuli TaxID=45357 RepID=A0A2V1B0A6_9ASCO|nr:hypothetical protein CXQ85_002820 [[Candida] haemuloni]KAF3987542.1 hypothetical protein FT663_04419 [[Candida] haemuloni var. vulneris]KAF3991005.1 hypothetical protein FT662_01941 [[Candida] haemuloni var. vulneris]PVH23093.1 hypothetical protein CXQ85_002820 [[Candida] haemuloni]